MSKLDTKNLNLKVRTLPDVDALYELYLSLQVKDGSPPRFPDRDSVVKSVFLSDSNWRKNGYGYWSIFHKEKLVGNIGLKKTPEKQVYLELEIHPKFRRKGYGKEAALAVIDFAFRLHKISEINVAVESLNTIVETFLTALGFEQGRLKNPQKK